MIIVLTGENSFEIEQQLRQLKGAAGNAFESVDGATLAVNQLPELLQSDTLFANKRLIIVRDLAANKQVWPLFDSWVERVSDNITLVLIEPRLDKRSKTYKALQAKATIKTFVNWSDRDQSKAMSWLQQVTQKQHINLTPSLARLLVNRVGVDQWSLYHALEKLALAPTISQAVIEAVVEPNPSENVFNLFEAALKGQTNRLQQMLAVFKTTQDPYQLFGLLGGQVFQLAALSVTKKPVGVVAKDLSLSSYSLERLASYTPQNHQNAMKQIVQEFVQTDTRLKTSPLDPWIAIEQVLINIALQE